MSLLRELDGLLLFWVKWIAFAFVAGVIMFFGTAAVWKVFGEHSESALRLVLWVLPIPLFIYGGAMRKTHQRENGGFWNSYTPYDWARPGAIWTYYLVLLGWGIAFMTCLPYEVFEKNNATMAILNPSAVWTHWEWFQSYFATSFVFSWMGVCIATSNL